MGFNLYKVKKATAYIKHYGPDKLAKKALGKLIDKDDILNAFWKLNPMTRSFFLREEKALSISR